MSKERKEKISDVIPIGDVVIVATKLNPFIKEGKEVTVTSELAKTLIKKGFAKLK